MADHFFQLCVGEFVGIFGTIYRDSRDGTRINKLRDVCSLCGFEKILCTAHVRIVNVLLALGPQAIVGGNMEDSFDSRKGASERSGIAKVAGYIF